MSGSALEQTPLQQTNEMPVRSNTFSRSLRTSRDDQTNTTNRDRWMVSYLDVLTITLIFFVVIAAQSLIHPQSPPAPAEAQPVVPDTPAAKSRVHETPASPQPDAPSEPHEALLRAQESLEGQGIELSMKQEGLLITLPQEILFASGKERVSREALPLIAHVADVLRAMPNEVRLVGYADSTPIHNRRFKNNWELAMARSLRIQELLSKQFGIPESRLSIASYGPFRPSGSNDTPDGRAQNRRVEILILDEPEAPSDRAQYQYP